ncbi:MAG: TonB-dependent receptor, partial [Bacteroidota bacterium]
MAGLSVQDGGRPRNGRSRHNALPLRSRRPLAPEAPAYPGRDPDVTPRPVLRESPRAAAERRTPSPGAGPMRHLSPALLVCLFLAGACPGLGSGVARGQSIADTLDLPNVRVEAARSEGGIARAPFSVAVVERGVVERSANAGAGLEDALRTLPGLFVADRENAALGERLIVRGQGYRSAFGVRGVQVVLDGIPLTLADGQAVLGVVDPVLVRRAEIVRGPASALRGNGSGGVLFLDTVPPAAARASGAEAQVTAGAFGLVRASGEGTAALGEGRAGVAVSRTERDGYRDYSAQEIWRARGFVDVPVASGADLRVIAALEESPLLQHPGALTAEQLDADRRQAEARFPNTTSGKRSTQGQVAARLTARTPEARFSATAYGIARDLRNPLPFAYIGVDRLAGGLRLSAEREVGPLALALGADGAVQRDDRFNAPNENGEPGAVRTLDQLETVASGGLFARAGMPLAGPLRAEAALRADRVRFEADDRLLADGDQSGSRTLGALSPQVGLSYRARGVLAFASFA